MGNACSRCREQSVLAPDRAEAPLGLRSPADDPCLRRPCTEDYKTIACNNPGKRLEFSRHKPDIFLKFHAVVFYWRPSHMSTPLEERHARARAHPPAVYGAAARMP
jgi:hypothetical protein